MPEARTEIVTAELAALGERFSELRLCEASSLALMQRSLEQYGQLTPLVLLAVPASTTSEPHQEIVDGFKRVRAARALGWHALTAHVLATDVVEAKLRLRQLHEGRGFTELEEAWLVRSLCRDDHLAQSYVAQLLHRHKSWVWRRLMLVESLEPCVQSDVRLGLVAPRAAVAVSRLPRGNQLAASAVIMRRGPTVGQADRLVSEVLDTDELARAALLERRKVATRQHRECARVIDVRVREHDRVELRGIEGQLAISPPLRAAGLGTDRSRGARGRWTWSRDASIR